ncbi:MAG: glycosyltransferase family 9 protein [Deltaproteobacteria bacterium]|jgi:lipopolysaccharide heptosyltransferase I|nr:glycosyltransferase family 9 protein [Deltaproteobacteria bacterium]
MSRAPILVVKLSSLGDAVMSLPFLEALRERFPDSALDWVAEEPSASLLRGHPLLRRVIPFTAKKALASLKAGRFRAAWKTIRDLRAALREERYGLVFDLQGLFKSGLATFWARGERKIGFANGREGASLFLTEKLPPYDPSLNATRRYLLLAESVGAAPAPGWESRVTLKPTPADLAAAQELLGPLPRPFVALVLGTRWNSKLWPVSHFAALASLLAARGLSVALIGSPGETALQEEFFALRPPSPDARGLVGLTSPSALKGVLSLADLTVTADSGPMHLSAALGTRAIALFGPTRPERTAPLAPWVTVLRPEGFDCLGCLSRRCPLRPPRSCLAAIAPSRVLAEILGGRAAPPGE